MRMIKKITMYPILCGLLVNVMAIGRSGILTFVLLVVLFSFLKYNGERYVLRNPFGGIFTLTVGIIVLLMFYNLLENYFADMFLNFQRRGLESVRTLIWMDYMSKTLTSIKYIIFGTPISGTVLLDEFSHNLHNSFFMLHAKYGMVPLVVVIGLIVNSMIYFVRKKNMLYLIILIAVLFRMQFDYTNFNAQLDIIFFYIIFFPYMQDRDKKRKVE